MRYIDHLKKLFVLIVAALSISILNIPVVGAQAGTAATNGYLATIARNTTNILNLMQNVGSFSGLTASWMQTEDKDTASGPSFTTANQKSFASLGQDIAGTDVTAQIVQPFIIANMLGVSVSTLSAKSSTILSNLPNINDMLYPAVMGAKPFTNAPNINLANFISYAGGYAIPHTVPSTAWQGKQSDVNKYTAYFSTVTAIQTFNAYVLSLLAIDGQKQPGKLQDQLINNASSSSWIAQIETEELGRVMRQMLLFLSQNYVLNIDIQRTLRQILAAQAMTNTMLISINGVNEGLL